MKTHTQNINNVLKSMIVSAIITTSVLSTFSHEPIYSFNKSFNDDIFDTLPIVEDEKTSLTEELKSLVNGEIFKQSNIFIFADLNNQFSK